MVILRIVVEELKCMTERTGVGCVFSCEELNSSLVPFRIGKYYYFISEGIRDDSLLNWSLVIIYIRPPYV